MDWSERFDSFVFNHHKIINNKIHAVTAIKFDIFINNRQGLLSFKFQTADFHFVRQTFLISGFKKPRPQNLMDFNGRADYYFADFILMQIISPISFLRVLCVSVFKFLLTLNNNEL